MTRDQSTISLPFDLRTIALWLGKMYGGLYDLLSNNVHPCQSNEICPAPLLCRFENIFWIRYICDEKLCSHLGLVLDAFLVAKLVNPSIKWNYFPGLLILSRDERMVLLVMLTQRKSVHNFFLKDVFFKTMSERSKLLEKTCDSNRHLRIAKVNRNDFFHIHIKVILLWISIDWHWYVEKSISRLVSSLQGSIVLLDTKHVQASWFEWNTDIELEQILSKVTLFTQVAWSQNWIVQQVCHCKWNFGVEKMGFGPLFGFGLDWYW